MGYWSKKLIEDQEREFDVIGKYVCCECVKDKLLKKIITDNLQKNYCDYCKESNQSAPAEFVAEKVLKELKLKYTPYHELVLSPDETYGVKTFDTKDVLSKLGYGSELQYELFEDINKSILERNDIWCVKDPFGAED